MLAGGGVGPFAGGALAMFAALQTDIEAAPLGALDVAGNPVAPFAVTGGELVTADGFRVARKLSGKVRSGAGHKPLR